MEFSSCKFHSAVLPSHPSPCCCRLSKMGEHFKKSCNSEQIVHTTKPRSKSTHSRHGHKMFNKIRVKAQQEPSPHSTRTEKLRPHFTTSFPIFLRNSATRRSMFSHHTPLHTITAIPGWERLQNTPTVGSQGSSNTATKPLAFPDTTGLDRARWQLSVQASTSLCSNRSFGGNHASTCLLKQETCYRSTWRFLLQLYQRASLQSCANRT